VIARRREMFGFTSFNFLRLLPLACLLFGARAFAQFEIAPDHFDSETDRPAAKTAGENKSTATAPRHGDAVIEPASMHAAQLNQQIAEQQAVLAEYRAHIKAKTEQMEAALQSLMRTGNEAGEAEALVIFQRELDNLQESLAPAIHATEATLARLQAEVATKSQLPARHPAKRRAL
jgi:flagellar biosynthesis/type III secretory pathway protein FliH